MTSSTYVYTYIAFALAYFASSLLLLVYAFKTSGRLSAAGREADKGMPPAFGPAQSYISHGQRVVDYTQLATLLPLVYIVLSVALGSVILHNTSWAGLMNAVWIAVTLVGMGACALLAMRVTREARALAEFDPATTVVGERTADAASRLSGRLSMSAGLLILMLVFTTLNLWSIVANLTTVLGLDYVL